MTISMARSKISTIITLITLLIFIAILLYKHHSQEVNTDIYSAESKTLELDIDSPSKPENVKTDNNKQATKVEQTHRNSIKKARETIRRIKINSVYKPDSPYDAYSKHIASAESGNIHSQYIITNVLEDCNNWTPKNELDELRKALTIESKDKIGLEIYEYSKAINELCNDLFEQTELNNTNRKLVKSKFQNELINNGHPVALAELMSSNGARMSKTKPKDILTDSLKYDPPKTYQNIAIFIDKYQPKSSRTQSQAWHYLDCLNRASATVCKNSITNSLKSYDNFYDYEIDEIFTLADTYQTLINEERWDELLTDLSEVPTRPKKTK